MATRNSTETPLNVPLARRFDLGRQGAFQIICVQETLRTLIEQLYAGRTDKLYAAIALVDRIETVADTIHDALSPEHDHAQTDDDMAAALHVAAAEVSHAG